MISGNEKLVMAGAALGPPFIETLTELSGVANPNILVDTSPKASAKGYDSMRKTAGVILKDAGLGAAEMLYPSFEEQPEPSHAADLIDGADILLVSGGSTRIGVRRWKELGIFDKILERVRAGELVAGGASAGSMIWFDTGYSDSNQYEVAEGDYWNYSLVKGSGLLPSWITAHYSDVDDFNRLRSEGYRQFLANHEGEWKTAIGIDTFALMVCNDGLFSAVASHSKNATADEPKNVYLYREESPEEPHVLGTHETIPLGSL